MPNQCYIDRTNAPTPTPLHRSLNPVPLSFCVSRSRFDPGHLYIYSSHESSEKKITPKSHIHHPILRHRFVKIHLKTPQTKHNLHPYRENKLLLQPKPTNHQIFFQNNTRKSNKTKSTKTTRCYNLKSDSKNTPKQIKQNIISQHTEKINTFCLKSALKNDKDFA